MSPQDTAHCREVFAVLSEYLDVELPPQACEQMRRHIEGCAPCVEFVESLKKSVALCRQYEPETMPRPLSDAARRELLSAWQKTLGK